MPGENDRSDIIRFVLVTLFIVVFFGVLLYMILRFTEREAVKLYQANTSTISNFINPQASRKPEKQSVKMIFAGDIMLDRGVESMVNKYGGGDWKFPFLKVADRLKTADVVFGNLEGPVSDKGYKAGSIYSFRADPKAIEGLKYAGFNVMSCANNHMLDYTRAALEDTLVRMKEAGILCVGAGINEAEALSPKFLEIKSNKIAFLGYADFGIKPWLAGPQLSGLAEPTETNLKKGIEEANKAGANLVVVSFHFGDEYQDAPNDRQKELARKAADIGADLVIGHHPHVVEPVERYERSSGGSALDEMFKPENMFNYSFRSDGSDTARTDQAWIIYSLGNFVFDQYFSKETMQGEILEVFVENGKITSVKAEPVNINSVYQPEIAD